MLKDLEISKGIVLATGLAFLVFITIGIENYCNWRFVLSLTGFISFILLVIFDLRVRNKSKSP